jgi:hypothetical protein
MIGAKVNVFTTFDRKIIHRNWSRINESAGKKAGLLVRRIARNSLRQVAHGRPSPPGMPPHSHAWSWQGKPGGGRRRTTAPLRLIYSLPERMGSRVIVGPVGFGDVTPVPEIQERGLAIMRRVPRRGWRAGSTSPNVPYRSRRVFAMESRLASYPPRPFMLPALVRAAPRLPAMWRGSLSRVA